MKAILSRKKALPFDINGDGKVDLSDVRAIFTGERHVPETDENFLSRRVKQLWSKHEHKFVLLSLAVQKREKGGRSWVRSKLPFGEERQVTAALQKVGAALEDSELMIAREDYMACLDEIRTLKQQAADVRASISMQPGDSGKLQRTLDKIEAKSESTAETRIALLNAFRQRMDRYGVSLSNEQAEVLLSRIDAGDVTRMSSVFAVLSAMTSQFADAKRESGENIDVAKKYYAIYLGLLELQMSIQSEYINNVDNGYLPGVRKLGHEARDLLAETKAVIKGSSKEHRDAYRQNISSQEFTIKVTEVYEDSLRADRSKVQEAHAVVQKIHQLAANTLATVRVSSDLLTMMKSAETMLQEVLSLQTPELHPFENLDLQREFEAVTMRLQQAA